MTNQKICFFSSDQRPLYKEDVFKAITLPEKHVLHLRYKKKWIQDTLVNDIPAMIGVSAILFFAPVDENSPFIEIRSVTIVNVFYDVNTDVVHFYVSLNETFFGSIVDFNKKELLPPNKFVSRLNVIKNNENRWIEKIKQVRPYFGDILYFRIIGIKTKCNGTLYPKYSELEKEVFYGLDEDSDYVLEVLFADFSEGKSKFKYDGNKDTIFLNMPQEFEIGAEADVRSFGLVTHSISKAKIPIYLKFISESEETIHEVMFKMYILKSKFKAIVFGISSLVALFGISFAQFLVKKLEPQLLNLVTPYHLIASVFLIVFAASLLFYYYDKK